MGSEYCVIYDGKVVGTHGKEVLPNRMVDVHDFLTAFAVMIGA